MKLFTGFDGAILGHSLVWDTSGHRHVRVVYSGPELIEQLKRDGLSEESALEWVDFNMEGAYVGPDTPVVMWPAGREELDEIADNMESANG